MAALETTILQGLKDAQSTMQQLAQRVAELEDRNKQLEAQVQVNTARLALVKADVLGLKIDATEDARPSMRP